LFDLIDGDIYAYANFYTAISTVEVGLLIDESFSKRKLKVSPGLLPVKSMMIAWSDGQLIFIINCKNAGSIGFTLNDELKTLSLPYFKPNALLTSGSNKFFKRVREALVSEACVDKSLLFPSLKAKENSNDSIKNVNPETDPGKNHFIINFNTVSIIINCLIKSGVSLLVVNLLIKTLQ
jgi:hypothetical protein